MQYQRKMIRGIVAVLAVMILIMGNQMEGLNKILADFVAYILIAGYVVYPAIKVYLRKAHKSQLAKQDSTHSSTKVEMK
ncbi:hypothetical protein N9R79_08835 [Vibrio sp.]|nr:hypothetical protein [Vibrio sp.]